MVVRRKRSRLLLTQVPFPFARPLRVALVSGLCLTAPLVGPTVQAQPTFGSINPFGLSDVGLSSIPSFADLDGDGDFDALVGEKDGNLFYFQNTGSAAAPAFAAPQTNPFGFTDVGLYNTPVFADLDGDGDFDATVGTSYGNLVYFQNTGSTSSPAFAAPQTNPFGLSDVGTFSSPAFADLDGDGDFDAIVGEGSGNLIYFENTASSLGALHALPAFAAPVENPFGLTSNGTRSMPAFVDLDADGDADFVSGAHTGELLFLRNLDPGSPLPVELSTFSARIEAGVPVLKWTTNSETNNAGFEVQHAPINAHFNDKIGRHGDDANREIGLGVRTRYIVSPQEADWHVLAFIEGHGTTAEAQSYQYQANELAAGHHRFRLKQVDFDGAFAYSQEVEVVLDVPGTHGLSAAYPNPLVATAQFSLIVSRAQPVTVTIYDLQGRLMGVVFEDVLEANQVAFVTLDGTAWPSGTYIYEAVGETFRDRRMVTVIK